MNAVRFVGRTLYKTQQICVRPISNNKPKFLSTQVIAEDEVKKLTIDASPSAWRVCAATCLIRLPILEAEFTAMERKYSDLSDSEEFERSCLSEWELETIRQDELIASVESGAKYREDVDFKESNKDLEDQNNLKLKEFEEKNKAVETPTDENRDLADINRRPDQTLVLATKQVLGKDHVWMLPNTTWNNEESLRQAAERALISHSGQGIQALFISNGPSGFYKYKFPKEARNDAAVGAKQFIYVAYLPRDSETHSLLSFELKPTDENILEHAWLARDEMKEFMKPKYMNAVQRILL